MNNQIYFPDFVEICLKISKAHKWVENYVGLLYVERLEHWSNKDGLRTIILNFSGVYLTDKKAYQ